MQSGAGMFWLSVVSLACWPISFWWMWRISRVQNELLRHLHEQARRIERVATAEHNLIKEAHPQIGQIKDTLEHLAEKRLD